MSTSNEHQTDVLVVGGGIAGLWTLHRLLAAGYDAYLFETGTIGGGQTLASQGMIHGGLKYALGGALTGATDAIAGMPERWRACLQGSGEIDLSAIRPLSEKYYMFAAASALGKLTTFFASHALRGRIDRLSLEHYPEVFKPFTGVVYELNDFVVDVPALLKALVKPVQERVFQLEVDGANLNATDSGWRLRAGNNALNARYLANCTGCGARNLLRDLQIKSFKMQRRPLRQVVVRQSMPHPLYAHCLTGIKRPEPRLTLTTHEDVLYIGGQLAEAGVERSDDEQIAFAKEELATCLPWLDFSGGRFETLYVDRAEPQQQSGERPDCAYVAREGRFIQCWPTKLTLTPDLADQVLAHIEGPGNLAPPVALGIPTATVGQEPWSA